MRGCDVIRLPRAATEYMALRHTSGPGEDEPGQRPSLRLSRGYADPPPPGVVGRTVKATSVLSTVQRPDTHVRAEAGFACACGARARTCSAESKQASGQAGAPRHTPGLADYRQPPVPRTAEEEQRAGRGLHDQ